MITTLTEPVTDEFAAASAEVDAAIKAFTDDRKLTYKLAVEAFQDPGKGSYCQDGMNTKLVRLHFPRWTGTYTDSRGRERYAEREYGWTMPDDVYDGHSTSKKQQAMESEDRDLYTALGLKDLTRRINEAHDQWRTEVLALLDGEAKGYYTPNYYRSVREQLGYPPVREAQNVRLEFGWLTSRAYDEAALSDVLEPAIQEALRKYDANAELATREVRRTVGSHPNGRYNWNLSNMGNGHRY
jgi:hypothetical protein